MRPARKGPENARGPLHRLQVRLASMRPARKGPENLGLDVGDDGVLAASMRPARKGPENADRGRRSAPRDRGFNEAGPQGAGKRILW